MAILFIAFLTLFSLDEFNGHDSIPSMLTGFFIHNIPSIVLGVTLFGLRRRPVLLGSFYILISIAFAFFFHSYRSADLMSLPLFLFLTGLLFLVFSGKTAET